MPAKTERQRRAAAMARKAKQGKISVSRLGRAARSMYRSMPSTELRSMAKKQRRRKKR